MSDLLIHSMSEFSSLIVPLLRDLRARSIVEIGSEGGLMSRHLAELASANGGTLYCIDPAPRKDFLDWVSNAKNVVHIRAKSLEAIQGLTDVDAWLIDGDHNWYTVFNELTQIREVSRGNGKPLLCFLHDVTWPCDRRDLYYVPKSIPAEFLHPHSYDSGVILDSHQLQKGRGFRGNGSFGAALHYGGPRNGVLTAVEDFIFECHTKNEKLLWSRIPAIFGLGVICDPDPVIAKLVAKYFVPFHENELLAKLEDNRLRNYLKVIDLQDQSGHPA